MWNTFRLDIPIVDATANNASWATAFTWLTDVPASYSWQWWKVVAVNSWATALEFITPASWWGWDYIRSYNWTQIKTLIDEIIVWKTITITKIIICLDTLPVGQSFKLDILKNNTSILSWTLDITTTESATNSKYLVATWWSWKATISTAWAVLNDILWINVAQIWTASDLNLRVTILYTY